MLGADGTKVFTPIKASLFYQNPGLKFLEKRFLENEKSRKPYRNLLKNKIDQVLNSGIKLIDELKEKLEQQKIQFVCRTNPEGIIYGLTYIDHESKYVFNDSKLGKAYSAKAIQKRFARDTKQSVKETKNTTLKPYHNPNNESFQPSNNFQNTFLEVLLQAENCCEPLPYQLKKSLKKKRRKHTTHL